MVALLLLPCALQLLIQTAQALPIISFPINSQVPPVARISEAFSFVFSSSTFTSSLGDSLSYSLTDGPSWLSIDSDARRLYGIPDDADVADGDVVGVPVSMVASDGDGSTALNATLVVSRNPAPVVQVPLSSQISDFGNFSAPSSILSYPDRTFSFSFAQDTFSDSAVSGLNYYAVMDDNSPLPSWVTFTADTLTFSGRTPPFASLVQPPQTFTFQLVASDVVGFSGASVVFSIVVGGHELTVDDPLVELNVTVGVPVNYTSLQGDVMIDGEPANTTDIASISGDGLPSWLTLNSESWEISGTPPSSAKSTTFSVVLEDAFSDSLNITFNVTVIDGAFRDDLPELTAKAGGHLDFDLKPYLWDPTGVEVSADIQPSMPSLSFNTSDKVLSGDIPDSAETSTVRISFRVKSESSDDVDSKDMTLRIASNSVASSTTSSSSASSSSTSTVSASTASTTPSSDGQGKKKASVSAILLAVLLSLLFFSFLLSLGLFCYRRKRQQKRAKQLERKHISAPIPGSFTFNGGMDVNTSMRELDKQYGIGYAQTPNIQRGNSGARRSFLRGLKRPERDLEAPRLPPIPPITLHSPTSSAGGNGATEPNSWLAPFRALTRRGTRRQSTMSDATSISSQEFGINSNVPSMVPSMVLLGEGSSKASSRTHLAAPHTPSIQHTPQMAYSGQSSDEQWQDVYSANASSITLSTTPGLLEARPISGFHSQDATTSEGQSSRPWLKNNAIKFMKHAKAKKSLLSLSTIDTFADRARSRRAPGGLRVFGPADHAPLSDQSRPTSRKGEEPAPEFGNVGSSPAEASRQNNNDLLPAPLRISSHPRPSQEGYSVDSLGISQEPSAAGTPVHPSKTWSTVDSTTDDWLEDISQRLDTAISDNEPNWRIIRDSPAVEASRYRRYDPSGPSSPVVSRVGELSGADEASRSNTNGSLGSAVRSGTRGSSDEEESFAVYI